MNKRSWTASDALRASLGLPLSRDIDARTVPQRLRDGYRQHVAGTRPDPANQALRQALGHEDPADLEEPQPDTKRPSTLHAGVPPKGPTNPPKQDANDLLRSAIGLA